jgi:hypothetical protein
MKPFISVLVVTAALDASGFASARQPAPLEQSVSPKRHPIWPRRKVSRAGFYEHLRGQAANEFDLDGYAVKAKNLIDEANRQLKQAAAWAKLREDLLDRVEIGAI